MCEIRQALDAIAQTIQRKLIGVDIVKAYLHKNDSLRLIVGHNDVQVKIELSPVLRGTVFEPALMTVCEAVEDEFGFAEIAVVTLPDLYAGKICAALDRQHPRDLFDIKWLLENEGVTDDICKALVVYLVSHNRPLSELLSPQRKNIKAIYEGEFAEMTEVDVPLRELEAVRENLIELVHSRLTPTQKRFLLSFKSRQPSWELLGIEGVEKLPAIKWKLHNLSKMPNDKHHKAYERLKDILGLIKD